MESNYRKKEMRETIRQMVQSTSLNETRANASIARLISKTRSSVSKGRSGSKSDRLSHSAYKDKDAWASKISPAKVGGMVMEDSRFTEDYELERLNREIDTSALSGRKKKLKRIDQFTNSRDLAHHFEAKQRK